VQRAPHKGARFFSPAYKEAEGVLRRGGQAPRLSPFSDTGGKPPPRISGMRGLKFRNGNTSIIAASTL
jgi:hypothetical protein